jgi:hypothetical protein
MLMVKNDTYPPSTNFPKLTFCSSLSKDRLSDESGVATMLLPFRYTCAQTRILLQNRMNYSDKKTYSYYLAPWGL